MKLKVIACGVFEPELERLVKETTNQIHLVLMDAGLHSEPATLRQRVQDHIDSAAASYDAVVVLYGMCGRGTAGLVAREIPVVLPRVHDCISLFLGSAGAYRKEFARHPGTYYSTPGWHKHKHPGESQATRWNDDNVREHPQFDELAGRYGEENAAHIIIFHDSWKGNYTRAAFIDTLEGQDDEGLRDLQMTAEALGWEFERIPGSLELLSHVLQGNWEETEALVLRPGQRSVLTGDDRIFAAADLGERGSHHKVRAVAKPNGKARRRAGTDIGLGIDAGGTYTDCVLYDFRSEQVLAKAKSLSTPYDLMVGIDSALAKLGIEHPSRVSLVALSTTLATNAIVEGKGGRPGLLLTSAVAAGLDQIVWRPRRVIPGALAIDGYEMEPLDEEAAGAAVRELLEEGVDSFAISGYASTKNPAHEQRLRAIVEQACDLPVICGHELSMRLNYVERANTAVLNARLLPVIRELIVAARASLRARGIKAPLMIVKSDGTLVNEATAMVRPIETVLSGPAASMRGAHLLSHHEDAVVVDMGGTTTDAAMLKNGLPKASEQGAVIGHWHTSVDATDLRTVGLGGDSYVQFNSDRKLLVGPRRVMPLSHLCTMWPQAKPALMSIQPEQVQQRSSAVALDFFTLAREPRRELSGREAEAVEALREAPLSRQALAVRLGLSSSLLLNLGPLEAEGVVLRAGLTPTDLLHCDGRFTAWDVEAARKGLEVFADLYGAEPGELKVRIEELVVRMLALEVLRTVLGDHADLSGWDECEACQLFFDTAFGQGRDTGLTTTLTLKHPIVAIGGPVWAFFPRVGQQLHGRVTIPEHAEVANAVGAIASEVVTREQASVRPGEVASWVLHWRDGRLEFDHLEAAIEEAKRRTGELAATRALAEGTDFQEVTHEVAERTALSADGIPVMLEAKITATVRGRPAV